MANQKPRRNPRPQGRRRTAWHPLFVHVLRLLLRHKGYSIRSEHQLHHQPLRIDVVVIRKRDLPALSPGGVRLRLEKYLGHYTLIELKGPRDQLTWEDVFWLLGYADGFCPQHQVRDPREITLVVVASRISPSFLRQIELCGGRSSLVEPGVYQVDGLMYPLYCLETEEEADHILHLFSPSFVRQPTRAFSLLTDEERAIFVQIYDAIEHFKQDPRAPLRFVDHKEFNMSMEEFLTAMLSRMPPERRLQGLSPEEMLRALLAQQDQLKDLPPEQKEQLRQLLDRN